MFARCRNHNVKQVVLTSIGRSTNCVRRTIYGNVADTRHSSQLSLQLHTEVSPCCETCNVTLQNCSWHCGTLSPQRSEPASLFYPVIAMYNPSETTWGM